MTFDKNYDTTPDGLHCIVTDWVYSLEIPNIPLWAAVAVAVAELPLLLLDEFLISHVGSLSSGY